MKNYRNISLLDCTLRDGGHLNAGEFGAEVIRSTIRRLVEARIDIIEVGFLWDEPTSDDVARFQSIADVKRVLPEDRGDSHFCVMADFIDLSDLEPCDGTVEFIRLSFKRHRLEWALETAKSLIKKGYKVYINPVNCNVYTDEQYLHVIEAVNEIGAYGFSIVDTFGVMRVRDLSHIYSLVEHNLDKSMTIGLHLHENLGLAYSLVQQFLQMASPQRRISVDGSLLGMGRVPGNLCIEQIADHLNYEYGQYYRVEPIFDAIDDHIAPIKKRIPWGYDIPYALSAKYGLHRTYAEFLLRKWKLRTSDIGCILSVIDLSEAELFSESYIERLYRDYMCVPYDDAKSFERFASQIIDRPILLLAPGASIKQASYEISEYVRSNNALVMSIHFVPDFVESDYIFYSNIKRYDMFKSMQKESSTVLTSNLLRYGNVGEDSLVFSFENLAMHGDDYCDDTTLMALNLLKQVGVTHLSIAGFDGTVGKRGSFYIDSLARDASDSNHNAQVLDMLKQHYSDININFLTNSAYEGY